MLDIPGPWKAVLSDIHCVSPSAVIAGGALRDLVFGGEPKDLDIFVPFEETSSAFPPGTYGACPGYLSPRGWLIKKTIPGDYCPTMREEVSRVEEFAVPGFDLPVQVIHVKLPLASFTMDVLRRMDFDACQVAWDGETIIDTKAFRTAVFTGVWSVVNCEDADQARRSIERGKRFSARFPNRTIDISKAAHALTYSIEQEFA